MSGDADAVLLAELDEEITLEVGVQLYLVNGRLYLGVGQAVSSEEDVVVAAPVTLIVSIVKKVDFLQHEKSRVKISKHVKNGNKKILV